MILDCLNKTSENTKQARQLGQYLIPADELRMDSLNGGRIRLGYVHTAVFINNLICQLASR